MVFLAPMGDFDSYLDLFADRYGFGPPHLAAPTRDRRRPAFHRL